MKLFKHNILLFFRGCKAWVVFGGHGLLVALSLVMINFLWYAKKSKPYTKMFRSIIKYIHLISNNKTYISKCKFNIQHHSNEVNLHCCTKTTKVLNLLNCTNNSHTPKVYKDFYSMFFQHFSAVNVKMIESLQSIELAFNHTFRHFGRYFSLG